MPRKEAGRRVPRQFTGAAAPVTAPRTPAKKPKAFVHPTPNPAKVNGSGSHSEPHRPVHFPVRTSDAAAWALFTLVVGTALIVACVLLTLGAPS